MSIGDTLILIISFAVLTLLVGHFAWGPVTKMMATRADKIDADIDYAENARKEQQNWLPSAKQSLRTPKQTLSKS